MTIALTRSTLSRSNLMDSHGPSTKSIKPSAVCMTACWINSRRSSSPIARFSSTSEYSMIASHKERTRQRSCFSTWPPPQRKLRSVHATWSITYRSLLWYQLLKKLHNSSFSWVWIKSSQSSVRAISQAWFLPSGSTISKKRVSIRNRAQEQPWIKTSLANCFNIERSLSQTQLWILTISLEAASVSLVHPKEVPMVKIPITIASSMIQAGSVC